MQARSNTLGHAPTHLHTLGNTQNTPTLARTLGYTHTRSHTSEHTSTNSTTLTTTAEHTSTLGHTRQHSGTRRNLNTLQYTHTDTLQHKYTRARTYTPKHTPISAGALKQRHSVLCQCASALACRSKVECVRVCLFLPACVSQRIGERANVPDVIECMRVLSCMSVCVPACCRVAQFA